MDEKKIKYRIAGYDFVLQDQVAQAARFVLWGKASIDEAIKPSLEASMAWCGICLILPSLRSPAPQNKPARPDLLMSQAVCVIASSLSRCYCRRSKA